MVQMINLRIKMKKLIRNLVTVAVIAASYNVPAETKNNVPLSSNSTAFTPSDIASYMGMTPTQFQRFLGAFDEQYFSPDLPEFIDIENHPSFLIALEYANAGDVAPEQINTEVEGLFKTNMSLFAGFLNISVKELEAKIKKFDELEKVINGLQKTRADETSHKSVKSASDESEDIEVIEVKATEDTLDTTTSGGHTSATIIIWNSGMDIGGGFSVVIRVNFRTSGGSYYGTQDWRVNRFGAYPVSNVFCDDESCSFNPF